MAQKKCPKCGEDNPSEAVMCWACYTPLSGASAAAPGTAAAPTRAATAPARPSSEEKDKKPISPPLVGALALVVLVGLGVGLKSMMAPPAIPEPPPILRDKPASTGGTSVRGPVGPTRAGGGGGGPAVRNDVPEPAAAAYQPFVLPNPRAEWGTMAIVPSNPDLGTTQAAALAAFTLRQYSASQMQQWKRFYIFVFRDPTTARTFSAYMDERNGQPLVNDDYEELYRLGVWANTLVRYEYRNGREKVLYPQRSPGSWWLDKDAAPV